MKEIDLIRGAGGGGGKGGGGGSAPKEADNTLFSAAKARIIDLISEGEIQGLVNGDKSIYLDETPLKDSNGNDNFDGYSYKTRVGTNSQTYIEGFQGTATQYSGSGVSLPVKVTKESPGAIVRTYTTNVGNVDAVRVTIYTPSLTFQKSNGDLVGSSVEYSIKISYDSDTGSFTNNYTIDGKTTQRYERSHRFDIPSNWSPSSDITITVSRITDDAPNAQTNNDVYFASYSIIVDNKLRYPNSALVATQFDARQFNAIPTRAYEIKGVKVQIPSNYTPYDPGSCSIAGIRRKDLCEARSGGTWSGTQSTNQIGQDSTNLLYDGDWDGTFTTAWTCNPAWILYDICTDDRYGLGKWLDANQLDKWALYEIGKYCDAVDSDGYFEGLADGWGNYEPRYACNLYLQGREEAFKVINDIASTFRGMLYWQQGQISPVQDSPKDPVMSFTNGNVINGEFTYEGTSRKQRHNVAHVSWNNPNDFYRQNVEYVEDTVGIREMNDEIFSTDIVAVGCTSQGQARRIGKWLLYTERYETETVTFKTGMEGISIRPGDSILVADQFKAGVRYGGRLASGSTTTTIELDAATPVTAGQSYTLTLINTEEACVLNGAKTADTTQEDCINNGGEWKPYVWTETKDVSTVSATESVTSLTVDSAFTNTPVAKQIWLLQETGNVDAQEFKVLAVRESEKNIYEISGLKHYSGKYDAIESNTPFSTKSTSNLPDPSDPIPSPSNLEVSEELYVDSTNNIKNRATLSWEPPLTPGTNQRYPYTAGYYVEYRRNDTNNKTNWISLGETSTNSVTIPDAPAGTIEFRVKTRRIF